MLRCVYTDVSVWYLVIAVAGGVTDMFLQLTPYFAIWVESIIKSRSRGGGRETEYRVHWVGFDNVGDLTWEPESRLTGGAAEYLAAFKKKKKSS